MADSMFAVVLCKHGRGQVAEPPVAALAVVEDLDVFPDGGFGLGAGLILPGVDQLVLQAAPKAFDGGVVVTTTLP
jgi:hypothetical protein